MTSDEKFPKSGRLIKTKDFRAVYKEGRSFRKNGFVICALANGLDINRVGFSVRARVVKLASARNRIRRLLRELYRRNKSRLKKGFDIVFVVTRDPGRPIIYRNTEKTFQQLVRVAGLLSSF
jgi:ribonuclease P protein component